MQAQKSRHRYFTVTGFPGTANEKNQQGCTLLVSFRGDYAVCYGTAGGGIIPFTMGSNAI